MYDNLPAATAARYVLSPEQLYEIEYFAENLHPSIFGRMDLFDKAIPWAHAGIYVFFCPNRWRIYIGESTRLSDRVREQLHLRKWAKRLIIFDFDGHLSPQTVKILEKRVLQHGYECFPNAVWDNKRFLFTNRADPFGTWGICPELDDLTRRVIDEIDIYSSAKFTSCKAPLMATHILESTCGTIYGIAHRNGPQTYLLKGSRLSAHFPNFRAIECNKEAFSIVGKDYQEGRLAWQSAVKDRSASLVVTDMIAFGSQAKATRFLTLGAATNLCWRPV